MSVYCVLFDDSLPGAEGSGALNAVELALGTLMGLGLAPVGNSMFVLEDMWLVTELSLSSESSGSSTFENLWGLDFSVLSWSCDLHLFLSGVLVLS